MDGWGWLWTLIVDAVTPLLWGAGGYVLVRLTLVLARLRQVTGPLPLTGHGLPLLVAALLALNHSPWFTRWATLVRVLETLTVLLLVFVLLHGAERGLLQLLEQQRRSVPRLMRDIARGVVLVLALFVAISRFFAVELGTLLLSSTVFTAILGFALQDLLKNVFAGIALQIERPFTPGDWIFIDQRHNFGRVLEMSWRAIRVRPRDGQIVVIPNSQVAQQQITNLSATGMPIAMRLTVAVDTRHPPNQVGELLKLAVLAIEGVVPQPAPFVYAREFTAAAATYEIKFWVQNYERYPEQQGAALARIWYMLQRHGIDFAPNEVVVNAATPAAASRQSAFTLDQIIQRLRRIRLLDVLNEQEIAELAENVEIRLFAAGEILAQQGADETELFAIARGCVRVEVVPPDGAAVVVNTLGTGEVFGERGMLMGEPRSASVVAETDTRTIVIDRADLLPFFERHPELPERLATILSERWSATSASLEEYERAAPLQRRAVGEHNSNRSLAERIRRVLFSLTD